MITGAIIMESLKVGTHLTESPRLSVREIYRFHPENIVSWQPETWTVLEFEADEADGEDIAQILADALSPCWYIESRSPAETFIVYPGHVFRYLRGDSTGRA